VIIKNGQLVGEGATEPRPGRHAEVVALEQAGQKARGATMYCTLEPHAHQGVSPPCTERIIAAGVATLVCPLADANPQVDGNGFRQLKAAGVEVINDASAEIKHQSEDLVAGFAKFVRTGLPLVTVKYAMSLDGKIATRTGDSRWITDEAARAEAHEMRRTSDAVITGIGTVLADNPRLTARTPDGASTGRPRLRVVVDSHGRLPADAALLKEPGDVLWVRSGDTPGRHGARPGLDVVDLPGGEGRVNLANLVELLGKRELNTVLVEGGGRLAGAFFDAGLADRVAAFVAPVVIGGEEAAGPVAGRGPEQLAGALRLNRVHLRELGQDWLITGSVGAY
jgi:diaminohydroxyphosphoribosylaminopyrimidine deaminase/5-amino-6-(5-phosphoribosylamino)uracil reductase